MRLIDSSIMELDREASSTRKMLERVPEGKYGWAPHPKSMTLGKLATHVATLPGWSHSLEGDGFDVGVDTVGVPSTPPTTAGLVALFDKTIADAKVALNSLDDAKAMGLWTLSMKGKTVFSMPRLAVVRMMILNHSVHHRGQLSVYLRLLDVPVPGMYGPSADENPFA
ncbi:MAG: DinB family protein [Thermoanaerobaculia bacterium]